MARIDDFKGARKLAAEDLAKRPLDEILKHSGFEKSGDAGIKIPFLDYVYEVGYPDFEFKDTADPAREIQLQEQVLILHYLQADPMTPGENRWISYREIPGATLYFSVFLKRAADPLKKVFGNNVEGFKALAPKLGGRPIGTGDAGFEFTVFPRVPVQYILWAGDEEFPAEANILFKENIGKIFTPEDVAWLAGMVVYRMMALGR